MRTNSIITKMALRPLLSVGLLFFSIITLAQSGRAIFSPGPLMNRTRIEPFMATLPDGKAVAFGGREVGFISGSYADFYDPVANTFTEIPMNFPHDNTYVVKLFDGRYYIIGGAMSLGVAPGYSSCEIFDPSNNTFTTAGSMNYARMWMAAAQLNDGRVLIAGAWYDNSAAAYAEYYDTSGHTYTTLGTPLSQPCADPVMLPTNDGGAVLFGGFPIYGGSDYKRVEYYSPTDNSFHLVSSEIIPGDAGWLISGSPFHKRPYADYRLSDGKYLLLASRPGEYGFLKFDPAAKSFSKVATEVPLMNTLTDGGFFDFVLDKTANVAYILGIDSGSNPSQVSLVAVDITNGRVYHPSSTFTMPSSEYLYPTLAFLPSVNKILLEGISSTNTDYFHATDKTYVITPVPALRANENIGGYSRVLCYPNPTGEVLNIDLQTTSAQAAEVTLYDLTGRVAGRGHFDLPGVIHMSVGHLPPGMYFYEILGADLRVRDKFIKY